MFLFLVLRENNAARPSIYLRCLPKVAGHSRNKWDSQPAPVPSGTPCSALPGCACPLPTSPPAPSLLTPQNPSLLLRARRPLVRVVADCTRLLTSERTRCCAGDFIKSLKGTALIAPETSTFHVAGAARCAAPGNGPGSPPGSKPSAF